MNLLWLLVVVFIVLAVIGIPSAGIWQHSYGYGPSGILFLVGIIIVVLLLRG